VPTPVKRVEVAPPAPPTVVEPPKVDVVDDDLAALAPDAKPRAVKKKVQGPAEKAMGELDKAYEALGDAGGPQNKFKLKLGIVRGKLSDKMGANEEALFVQEAEKLTREIKKAVADSAR
jgi:hypothetical protein